MRAVYAVSRIAEWANVSQKLKERFSILPVYWLCSSSYKQEIVSLYPDILYHETGDANRGIVLEKISRTNNLSKKLILEYSNVEREFYLMANRHDLDGSFSYEDRKRLYYNLLNYWLNVIEQLKIDLLILSETPHALSYFILYSVCKKRGISVVMLALTSLQGVLFARESIDEVPFVPVKVKNVDKLNIVINQNIDRVNQVEDKLWYMVKQRKQFMRAGVVIRLQALLFGLPFILEKMKLKKRKPYKEFYKHKDSLFENSMLTRSEFTFHRVSLRKRQVQMRSSYRSLSESPDLKKRYIYFPLHFQPERSSCPEGSVYADQQVLIQLLADKLPPDTWIYVKEHPSQFMMTRGPLGRPPFFYKDLKMLSNVILVDDSYSSRQLIDNSLAVLTLTGTAGMEAILRGRPVLVFGYAWYRNLPGVFALEEPEELDASLDTIFNGFSFSVNDVLKAIEEQKQYLFPGYVTRWSSNSISMTQEENAEALYQGFAALLKNLGYKENIVK